MKQLIPDDHLYSATKKGMRKSIEYMKSIKQGENLDEDRDICINQNEHCSLWAAMGECEANERYMTKSCAPACLSCDKLYIKNRCPITADNELIWKPGDANALFENIVDNVDGSGEYIKYSPLALSRPMVKSDGTPSPPRTNTNNTDDSPWLVLLDNFITDEEAEHLIKVGDQQGFERSLEVGEELPDGTHARIESNIRTSHTAWCHKEDCYEDTTISSVVARIAEVTKTETKNIEHLQLIRYAPGQAFHLHSDYVAHHRELPLGVRLMTFLIYLNDVEEGGETHFPHSGVLIQPRRGQASLWSNVLDGDPEEVDARTDHEGITITKGLKYIASVTIHSRDFKTALERECI